MEESLSSPSSCTLLPALPLPLMYTGILSRVLKNVPLAGEARPALVVLQAPRIMGHFRTVVSLDLRMVTSSLTQHLHLHDVGIYGYREVNP